jgi:hypothetical protein
MRGRDVPGFGTVSPRVQIPGPRPNISYLNSPTRRGCRTAASLDSCQLSVLDRQKTEPGCRIAPNQGSPFVLSVKRRRALRREG